MAIDKIFKSSNVDDLADNILSEVDDFMVSVDKMQQRKVAGNVQKVIQAFKQIETDLQDRYDNVTDVLEKRVSTIKDGRDGLNGTDGRSGRDGKPGRDGVNGKQGTPGTPGKDGENGVDGVSVTNANIDFDGSLVISLSSGQQINVGEVVPPELERQLVELRQGGGSAGSSGDVMGPTASTDNAIVRFDGTTGKLVQNSVVTIADTTGNMAGVGTLGVGAITTTGALVGTATQNAFNSVSTTLNMGGAATAVNIGAATGTLTVANTTLAAKAITASTTLGVTGLSTLTAGAVIQGLTVGRGAGAGVTNTVVGNGALLVNSTGLSNTAVGADSLASNLGGQANTGLGYQALLVNTSGINNTATGSEALAANISGSNNTAAGKGALYSNNTSNNTAVGSEAAFYSVGASNTAVGFQAYVGDILGTTTGTFNTTIGAGSGSALTSGGKNTIIGTYSGNQGGLDIRTASNYVVLSDGDGNPRAYWNGAAATFNGGLAVTGAATVSTTLGVTGVSTLTAGAVIQGLTVGLGAGAVATNTAVGFEAGAGVSTSADNTFIGYQAGKAASTGTGRSVAVGRGALATATTAIDNTVVGYFAGNKITLGNSNAFFGGGVFGTLLSTGNNTTSGSNNTAIGTGALATNSISGNSTAVGYSAGYLATGIGNQFFGYNSGSAVTTGAKNVILGSYTGSAAPISATGSNNIVLSDGDGVVRQSIDSSGNVGIGLTPAGAAKLEIKQALASQQGAWVYASANDSHARLFCDGTSVGLAAAFTSTGSYLPMTFYTSGTEKMRIDSSGNIYVGATASLTGNSERLGVTGSQGSGGAAVAYIYNSNATTGDSSSPLNLYKAMTTTTSSARFMQFYAAGTVTPMGGIVGNGASNVQFATISDAREKTNIQPMSGSLDKISALKPVAFDWIKSGEHVNSGFIAQDVETVFPEFVVDNMSNEGEEVRKGLTGGMTSGIIPHLVKAIQEQQAIIESLKARLDAANL